VASALARRQASRPTLGEQSDLNVKATPRRLLEGLWTQRRPAEILSTSVPALPPIVRKITHGGRHRIYELDPSRLTRARAAVSVDLVEMAPPSDVADTTSQPGARLITDTLAGLVEHSHLGNRLTREERELAERERDRATGFTE
jgi:hypothetical protein